MCILVTGALPAQLPTVQDSADDSVFLSEGQSKKSEEKAQKRQKMFSERSCSFSAESRAGMMKKGSLDITTNEMAMKMGADAKILTAALSKTPPHPQTSKQFNFETVDSHTASLTTEGQTGHQRDTAELTAEQTSVQRSQDMFDSLDTVKEESAVDSSEALQLVEDNKPDTLKDTEEPSKRNSFYGVPKAVEREGVKIGLDPLSLLASETVEEKPSPVEEKTISPVVARNLADEIESYMNLKSPLGSKSSSMELRNQEPAKADSQGSLERRSSLPVESVPSADVQIENQKNTVSRSKTFANSPKHHLKNQKERSLSLTALVRNSQHGSLGSVVNSLPGIKFDHLLAGPKMDVFKSSMKQAATVASKMWGVVSSAYSYSDDEVCSIFYIYLLKENCYHSYIQAEK